VGLTVWKLCAAFWPRGPNKEEAVLAGHIVSKYHFLIYFLFICVFFYLCVIDDNTFHQQCQYWSGKFYLKLIFKNGINYKKNLH